MDDIKNPIPRSLPVIYIDKIVMFPYLMAPLIISDEVTKKVIEYSLANDKLLGFFSNISARNLSRSFSLPFSLTDLADYLSIDRSAMMRELKLLQDDGIIKKNRNKITLLIQ